MEMIGKKTKWHLKEKIVTALLATLLILLYFWRTMIPKIETRNQTIIEVQKEPPKQLIVLAGQSNMAGRGGVVPKIINGERIRMWDGRIPPESHQNPAVYRFNEHFQWELAKEPIHYGFYCKKTCGVGIGMAFANKILELDPDFGVIGIVPCAAGGTSMKNWTTDTDQPYWNFLMRTRSAIKKGGILRAVLWYQGESDCKYYGFAKGYKKNLEKLIHKMRIDLQSPMLPFFQVIIPHPTPPFEGPFIEDVRKVQSEIDLPNVIKVDADGLPLGPDGVHLTTEGYVRLGTMLADSVFKNKSILFANNSSNINNTTISNDNTTSPGCSSLN